MPGRQLRRSLEASLLPQDGARGFFCHGGLVAMQTLWALPRMVRVAGYSPLEAAGGLFWINCAMLATFWAWGMASRWLARRGRHADRLIV